MKNVDKVRRKLSAMLDEAEKAAARGDGETAEAIARVVERVNRRLSANLEDGGNMNLVDEKPEPRVSDMPAKLRRALGEPTAKMLDDYAHECLQSAVKSLRESLIAAIELGTDDEPSGFRKRLLKEVGIRGVQSIESVLPEWRRGLRKGVSSAIEEMFASLDPEEEEEEEPASEEGGDDDEDVSASDESGEEEEDEKPDVEDGKDKGKKRSASVRADDFIPSGADYRGVE